MIIAGTGHRPEKIDEEECRSRVFYNLRDLEPSVFITGMAAGFDLWAADVIQTRLVGWDVWCAVPWAGHKPRVAEKELYERVKAASSQVIFVDESENYRGAWVYQKRNEWMVDHADRLLAYWDGTSGGTANCVKYAKKKGVPVRNIITSPPF
jgi:uncharacterized phage-like protein YoqJ